MAAAAMARKDRHSGERYALSADVILRCLSGIYAIAFASFWVQLPGLYGSDGILPVNTLLRKVDHANLSNMELFAKYPSLVVLSSKVGFDVDLAMDLSTLLGLCISVLSVRYGCGALAMFAQFFLYLGLYMVGETFLMFQWDSLLLEAGFAATFLARPGLFRKWTQAGDSNEPPMSALLLLRFVLFKLMFMSGVVKIQADCPTWQNLTACHYHFATQCIPTPLAWYFHQLPSTVLKLFVAGTLWIEISASFLILVPIKKVQKFAAVVGILLQVVILLSGNYNFFNLLTIVLYLTLFGDTLYQKKKAKPSRGERLEVSPLIAKSGRIGAAYQFLNTNAWVWGTFCYIFVCATAFWMFDVDTNFELTLKLKKKTFQKLVDAAFPYIICIHGAFIVLAGLHDVLVSISKSTWGIARRARSCTWRLFVLAAVLFTFIAGVIPFAQVAPKARANIWPGAWTAYESSQKGAIVGAYGLFRRMTGVGDAGGKGLTVARPEIVIEGSMDGENWVPYNFTFKIGDPSKPPPWVMPHQPRLDWQMWFASLGPNLDPWFLHLLYKLLVNEPAVLNLLGPNEAFAKQPPKLVRALKYKYAFTRMSDEIGNGSIVPEHWWTRQLVEEHVRPFDKNDDTLTKFIDSEGWELKDDLQDPSAWLKSQNGSDNKILSLWKTLSLNRQRLILYASVVSCLGYIVRTLAKPRRVVARVARGGSKRKRA